MQTIDLINHIKITLENIDTFKNLENEIIHFKEISAILEDDELEELKKKINHVIGYGRQEEQLKMLAEKLQKNEISQEEFKKEVKKINWFEVEEFKKDQFKINIKNIKNHYYIPVMVAEDSKEDLINYIIKDKREKNYQGP